MDHTLNELGQPIGTAVPSWTAPPRPPRSPLLGRYCQLVPLAPATHAAPLVDAYSAEPNARSWTYLAYGPFADAASYRAWLEANATAGDPLFLRSSTSWTMRPPASLAISISIQLPAQSKSAISTSPRACAAAAPPKQCS